jgi:ketosteroid isomerase-like protein
MAEQHLEAIRKGHEAFNQGDLGPAKHTLTDDVEWGTTGTWPGLSGTFHGPDALDAWMETIRAEWDEFEVSLIEVLREEDQAVIVAERLWGRGAESGIEVDMNIYSLAELGASEQ